MKQAMTLAFLSLLFVPLGPGMAEDFETTVPFELDEWIDLDIEDGAITLHRLRLSSDVRGLGRRMRDTEYTQAVQLQLEYSNDGDEDWQVEALLEWLDADGEVIQGLSEDFELDDDTRRGVKKEGVTALRYGLNKAADLRLDLSLRPD